MVVQRLSIQAAAGKLQVIAVWRCLAQFGVDVRRWNVVVDCKTGVESMTVDIVGPRQLCASDLAATLGKVPFQLTVTPFHLAVVSNPEAKAASASGSKNAHGVADSLPIARPNRGLTVVRNITRPKQD